MTKFSIEKITEIANELGIELEINSDNPGFHSTDENGDITTITYDDILNVLRNEFKHLGVIVNDR